MPRMNPWLRGEVVRWLEDFKRDAWDFEEYCKDCLNDADGEGDIEGGLTKTEQSVYRRELALAQELKEKIKQELRFIHGGRKSERNT